MAHKVKQFDNLKKSKTFSEKTNDIHYGKLYTGYVNKRNEIEEKISKLGPSDFEAGNQTYSVVRGLSEGETFAANGVILHELFFSALGGEGSPEGTGVHREIIEQFGSWERFGAELIAKGMSARGWAVLAYDPSDDKLHIYTADAHNQGGVWGCTPLLAVDVYEHAYFLDFGSDRKTYINTLLKEIDWKAVDAKYKAIKK